MVTKTVKKLLEKTNIFKHAEIEDEIDKDYCVKVVINTVFIVLVVLIGVRLLLFI